MESEDNLSKGGISMPIGSQDAKDTSGLDSTYQNTDISMTSINKRQKISGKSTPSSNTPNKLTYKGKESLYSFLTIAILLCYVCFLINTHFGETLIQRVILVTGPIILFIIYILISSLSFGPSEKSLVKKQIKSLSPNDNTLRANILLAHVKYLKDSKDPFAYFDATKYASPSENVAYEDFCDAFANCLNMSAIWQLDQSLSNEGSESWATTSVVKKLVSWCMANDKKYIMPNPTPSIHTLSNGMIYFYPSFVLHYINAANYEVWKYNQIKLYTNYVRFQESENDAPKDSERLGNTWMYVNKNGGPDRRYSYNPIMPILKYGIVNIETPIGIFKYYTSQYDCIVSLGTAFEKLKNPQVAEDNSESIFNQTNSKTELSSSLSRQYFEEVTDAVKKLYDFVTEKIESPQFQKAIAEFTIKINLGNGILTDKKEILQMLIWMDMIFGHVCMGHKINTEEPQSLGLLLYFYLVKNGETIPYEGMRIVQQDLFTSTNDVINMFIGPLNSQPKNDLLFQTARILDSCCQEDIELFKILMYRYFSLVSKGDGLVSIQEEKFLSAIMSIQKTQNSEGYKKSKEQKSSIASGMKNSATYEPMAALNELIGLATVKQEVETLRNFINIQKIRAQKGLKASSVSYHCVFTGNPGTGKTTVARIVASIYKEMGILKKGHLVETDRAGLVAEYVGQTAVKTNKKIDEALDGVLFIDEAYSLIGQGQDYGKEAIATLLKRMEDDRDRLVVIIAGYSKEMKDFIDANPGLQSRFNRYIDFPDYSADELLQIFEFNIKKFEYFLSDGAKEALQRYFENAVAKKEKNFGNARFVRNTFEKTLENQANRLASVGNLTSEKLSLIDIEDLPIK